MSYNSNKLYNWIIENHNLEKGRNFPENLMQADLMSHILQIDFIQFLILNSKSFPIM